LELFNKKELNQLDFLHDQINTNPSEERVTNKNKKIEKILILDTETTGLDENKNEIGIDGVKKLLLNHQNSSLQKELENSTEEIRLKSLKKDYKETGIKANNDILDDDLTIIGIGH